MVISLKRLSDGLYSNESKLLSPLCDYAVIAHGVRGVLPKSARLEEMGIPEPEELPSSSLKRLREEEVPSKE